ncbi:MAG: glycosyltransferase family 4 protein [Candidatus Eisenbacteria sp.]|nr:glycosyltransferase family 4 protein [Candidatus Eisenbacteria bacterium]
MLRILVINWRDIRNPEAGGAELHLHEIFRRIASRGHRVVLLASGYPGCPREETIDGIQVVRRGNWWNFNFAVPGAYLSDLRHQGFDIVVDDINKIPFYTPLYVHTPLLAVMHHMFGGSIFHETAFPFASYVYASERLIPTVYRRTRFTVVSESTRDELVSRGVSASRIAVIHNGIDLSRYRPETRRRFPEPSVVYLGRLKKYKSIDLVLRAMKRVLEKIPEAKLTIVGDGDDRPRLEKIAREISMTGSVRFTGRVSEREKIGILQSAQVVVNPSRKEGWGVTVIESNACGAPVIASDVPGLRDAVQDGKTGILVGYGDERSLASSVVVMLRNPRVREQFSRRAIAWARGFSWDRATHQTLQVIEEVVSETARMGDRV